MGTYWPGTVTASASISSYTGVPGGVTIVRSQVRVDLSLGGSLVASSGIVEGTQASVAYSNTVCGGSFAASCSWAQGLGSDGRWYPATSAVALAGPSQPQHSIALTAPSGGTLQDWPTAVSGRADSAPTCTLHDDTAGASVALGALSWDEGTGMFSASIPALTHGHSYTLTASVPTDGCYAAASQVVAMTIPARFTRSRSWDVNRAIGPAVIRTWDIVRQIGSYASRSWGVARQINSPAESAPDSGLVAAALAPLHRFSCRFYVMWDGINWTDETERLLEASGVDDVDLVLRYANTAQTTVTLDNGDNRFTLTNRASPIYAGLRRLGQRCRIDAGYNGFLTTVFYGTVDSILPTMSDRTASLTCNDLSGGYSTLKVQYLALAQVTADVVMRTILAACGLVEGVDFVLDTGTLNIPYAVAVDANPIEECKYLAQAEGGRLFFDQGGVLRFWNRLHHRRASSTPVVELTTDDHLYELARSRTPTGYATRVTMEWQPHQAGSAGSTVYSNGALTFQIPGGTYMGKDAQGNDLWAASKTTLRVRGQGTQQWERYLPAAFSAIGSIAANTKQDGTGSAVTCTSVSGDPGQATGTQPADLKYQLVTGPGYADVIVWSYRTGSSWIRTLTVTGTPQNPTAPAAVTVIDTDAADDVEVRLTNPYTPDAGAAMDRVREELAVRKDPLNSLDIPLQDGLPFLHPFDAVRVHDRSVPGQDEIVDGMVLRNEWRMSPSDGYTQQIKLGPVLRDTYRGIQSTASASMAAPKLTLR